MRPRGAGDAVAGAPLLPPAAPAAPHPGGTRLARLRASAARLIPASVERSILAYALVLCVTGATGLGCVPAFPLLWRCAGVLPLFSIFLLAIFFCAAYVVALLPDASNLLPAIALTTAMGTFYTLRLCLADKRRVSGPRSLADALFAALSVAEVAVLALGARRRQRRRAAQRSGIV